jgi:hypothetical protein
VRIREGRSAISCHQEVSGVEIVNCAGCGLPAEVEVWSAIGSTGGLVEHVKTRCIQRHWYLMPREMLDGTGHTADPG